MVKVKMFQARFFSPEKVIMVEGLLFCLSLSVGNARSSFLPLALGEQERRLSSDPAARGDLLALVSIVLF